jgi:2-dehydro-3-deoxygluconokinase
MRAAKVVYDRAGSAYYDLQPGMIPWREILRGADIFQVSGITAAISQQAADATFEALDIAEEMGITISFDINYRKNLWKYGANPRETLRRMLRRCDMMFGDAIEFDWISEHPQPPFTATDSNFKMQIPEYRAWFDELHRDYPRCRQWLMGMRNIVDSQHHTLTALLWTDGTLLEAPIVDIPDVVDPVGVGDAFMGGFLHAISLFPDDRQRQLDYSLAAASLKNTIPGDFNLSTEEEILDVLEHRFNAKTLYKTIE